MLLLLQKTMQLVQLPRRSTRSLDSACWWRWCSSSSSSSSRLRVRGSVARVDRTGRRTRRPASASTPGRGCSTRTKNRHPEDHTTPRRRRGWREAAAVPAAGGVGVGGSRRWMALAPDWLWVGASVVVGAPPARGRSGRLARQSADGTWRPDSEGAQTSQPGTERSGRPAERAGRAAGTSVAERGREAPRAPETRQRTTPGASVHRGETGQAGWRRGGRAWWQASVRWQQQPHPQRAAAADLPRELRGKADGRRRRGGPTRGSTDTTREEAPGEREEREREKGGAHRVQVGERREEEGKGKFSAWSVAAV